MEELIFFAVIILFSILESVARSRRARQQGEEESDGGPALPRPREWEAGLPDLEQSRAGRQSPSAGLPTYDDDAPYDAQPSYDERAQSRGRGRNPLEPYTRPDGTDGPAATGRTGGSLPSSQTMLPGDLLEQLEGLARGRKAEREEARTVDLPRQSPPLPSRPAPLERTEVGSSGREGPPGSTAPVGSRTPIGATPVEHRVHRSHGDYGTDPSTRAPSEQDHLDPLAEKLGSEAFAVRRQLKGGRAALRQAMVLKEVLGPPLALRGEGLTEG